MARQESQNRRRRPASNALTARNRDASQRRGKQAAQSRLGGGARSRVRTSLQAGIPCKTPVCREFNVKTGIARSAGRAIPLAEQVLGRQIPYSSEQGIFWREQGNGCSAGVLRGGKPQFGL